MNKEYVFIGGRMQGKTRDLINQLISENKELKNDYNKVVHESTEFESKIYQLQQENKQLKEEKEELKKWLEDEKYILAKSVSHIYEDSLGHSKFVNEDIYNELIKVSDKIKELEEGVK